jgi:uncharacterized membrane protein
VTNSALFLAVFLACAVEAVEALTIVLAAGTARDWRSALAGLLAAMLTLTVVVVLLGPALSAIPLGGLRVFVGAVLLVFGLQWLRKAILRASGRKARHDETMVFDATLAAAREAGPKRSGILLDWYAFTLSYKGVLLEGLEAAFIALTFGASQHNTPLAAAAAVIAVLVVAAVGFAVRAPLSRVPENSMKFIVGVMLIAFGMFWAAEGAGAHWPLDDAALLVLVPAVTLYALALVALFRRKTAIASPLNTDVAATGGAT